MLYPVAKLTRVPKVCTGLSNPTTTAKPQASQSSPQPSPASLRFDDAQEELGNVAISGRAQQQAGHAYAEVEQPLGRLLDITA
jgi:hypothetical protein